MKDEFFSSFRLSPSSLFLGQWLYAAFVAITVAGQQGNYNSSMKDER
jgi:hypothetical protein